MSFLTLPSAILAQVSGTILLPIVALSAGATLVAGLAIMQTRRLAVERFSAGAIGEQIVHLYRTVAKPA